MISPTNVGFKVFSITGALVADYYSNVENNSALDIELKVNKVGGLDKFTVGLSNNFQDPLFPDMICKFYVDGVHWDTGFAEVVPDFDTDIARVEIAGKGFIHKLKSVIVNEAYTSQTFDFILKDVLSSYLSVDVGVLYNVANIDAPTITAFDIQFKDKKLFDVLKDLLEIANYDFLTTEYYYYVDSEQYFHFGELDLTIQESLFEGYQYQDPIVKDKSDKIVNKVLTYRTTLADDNVVEYVATYSDADSIDENGEEVKKLTFGDYISTPAMANFANAIIKRLKDPQVSVQIKDLETTSKLLFGKYRLSNKKQEYFRVISQMNDLTPWVTTGLLNTTPTIDTTEVFTGRTSIKLVTAVGSATDIMSLTLPSPIYYPTLFKGYVYLITSGLQFTIRVTDTFNNSVDIEIGQNNEPLNTWLKFSVKINLDLGTGFLHVDYDVTNEGNLLVDYDVSNEGRISLDQLLNDGILNVKKIDIIVDSNIVGTAYFDQLEVLTTSYKEHELTLEKIEYNLGMARLADASFGDVPDNLVDEIKANVKDGDIALSVFSKQ